MFWYAVRRLIFALFLVFAVSSASLVVARLAPGDYAAGAMGLYATPEVMKELRARYGLDQPLSSQYVAWLSRAVRFDFGRSLANGRPVTELISESAANTAILAVTALLLATLVGLPLGVLSASRRGGLLTTLVRTGSVLLLSMPPLLTSLFLVF